MGLIRILSLFSGLTLLSVGSMAQTTRVLPWQPMVDDERPQVYHPEPILFIHGINANDNGWPTAINTLKPSFVVYDLPDEAANNFVGTRPGLNAQQEAYLHTFNYGDYPSTTFGLNPKSFDTIRWNAWAADRDSWPLTNPYKGTTQPAPADARQTLDERINGRLGEFSGIREAYATDPLNPATFPRIVLVAHSMGGLLSHYYLLNKPTDHGVRRLVTMATPHLGSHVANWVSWYNDANPLTKIWDNFRAGPEIEALRGLLQDAWVTEGFFTHGRRGAVWDLRMVDNRPTVPSHQRGSNPLTDYFQGHAAPVIEYVFNVYQRPSVAPIGAISVAINQNPATAESDLGDGVVPLASAAGKPGSGDSSIWTGVDPVIYGTWSGLDHLSAPKDLNSLLKSLSGVPYHWPPGSPLRPPIYSTLLPAYAHTYDENQSFSKYLALSDAAGTHTDEPGIGKLVLLYNRSAGNPMLVPSVDTWDVVNDWYYGWIRGKVHTNAADFVGHQIVASSGSSVKALAIVGTKNHSAQTSQLIGTNYWMVEGNEYLPASLKIGSSSGISPRAEATSTNMLTSPAQIVTNCLVLLNGGAPQYQYGLFDEPSGVSVTANTNNFVAAQGYNVAGLLTPQAERAFGAVVDSPTLVSILQKINQGEALSNACHDAGSITQWKATVTEWANTDSGSITLNFFPVSSSPNRADAWTNAAFSGDYAATTKTLTFTPADAPSQLIFSNEVYLGCEKTFTNSYGGIVSNLTDTSLAGVPVTASLVTEIRSKLEAILSKYKKTTSSCCTNWTKPAIIYKAVPPQTDWTPINNGLLLPKHFTELKAVTDLLTNELDCCTETNEPCACTNQVHAIHFFYSNAEIGGHCCNAARWNLYITPECSAEFSAGVVDLNNSPGCGDVSSITVDLSSYTSASYFDLRFECLYASCHNGIGGMEVLDASGTRCVLIRVGSGNYRLNACLPSCAP